MRSIRQLPLPSGAQRVDLELPDGAEILTLGVHMGVPRMWVALDPNAETTKRGFVVANEYSSIPDGLTYVGSYEIVYDGAEAASSAWWHLFAEEPSA